MSTPEDVEKALRGVLDRMEGMTPNDALGNILQAAVISGWRMARGGVPLDEVPEEELDRIGRAVEPMMLPLKAAVSAAMISAVTRAVVGLVRASRVRPLCALDIVAAHLKVDMVADVESILNTKIGDADASRPN